jgi:hypothetical protein
MLKDIINQNAKDAKQKLQEEINSQKAFIKLKEEMFYKSLISNPNNYSIREQATFLASCRATLAELEDTLAILEREFPTRNLEREFDLYGDMANECNYTWKFAGEEDEACDEQEQGL